MKPTTQFRKDVLSAVGGQWANGKQELSMEKIAEIVEEHGSENILVQKNWYPHKKECMVQVIVPGETYFSEITGFGTIGIGLLLEILHEDYGYFTKIIDF